MIYLECKKKGCPVPINCLSKYHGSNIKDIEQKCLYDEFPKAEFEEIKENDFFYIMGKLDQYRAMKFEEKRPQNEQL